MELRVLREFYTPDCTIGRMLINGQFECYTLEDGIRTNKVAGETAIPAGLYPVKITYSEAFRRNLPLVEGVRNFTGIRIHSGNTRADTKGCILVGKTWSPGADSISSSMRALQVLLPKIQAALSAGEAVTLTVEQPNAPPELASRELQPVVTRRRRKKAGPAKRASKSGARPLVTRRGSKPAGKPRTAAKMTPRPTATAKLAVGRLPASKRKSATRKSSAKAPKAKRSRTA